jgi:hypothetical protein
VSIASGTYARVRELATRSGATTNDVIAAALTESIAVATRDERVADSRRGVAIALPVDLRALSRAGLHGAAGAYISFLNLVLPGDDAPFERRLAAVTAITARAKTTRSHAASLLDAWTATILARGLASGDRSRYFSRQKPYCAVLSKPRVPADWLAPEVAAVCDRWLGATSTGPMTPLVAVLTTASDRMECVLTTRAYGYSGDQIDAIAAGFCARLESIG